MTARANIRPWCGSRCERGEQTRSVAGTLFAGSRPRIVEIKGIRSRPISRRHMLYVTNQDKPGFIGRFGATLAGAGINIATFHLGRAAQGGDAICLVSVDEPVPEDVLAMVRTLAARDAGNGAGVLITQSEGRRLPQPPPAKGAGLSELPRPLRERAGGEGSGRNQPACSLGAADRPQRERDTGLRQAGTQEIAPVQVLRAISAIAISIFHIAQASGAFVGRPGEAPYPWLQLLPWDASVDIFFVISGFVMVYASTRLFARPGRMWLFVGRRAARIFPLYWVATTGVLLVAFAIPHALSEPLGGGIGYILASYLLIPWQRPDGFVQPVFRLGWTLNYELLFYSIFTLFLILPRRWATACVRWSSWRWPRRRPPVVRASRNSSSGPTRSCRVPLRDAGRATLLLADVRLDMWARVALAAAGVLMLFLEGRSDGPWRLVTYGVPATLFLAAAVLGRPGGGEPSRLDATWRAAGPYAQYAIYLVHPFPMRALARGLGPAALDGDGGHRCPTSSSP